MWDLSCRDWEERIRQGRPLVPELPLWREEADIAVEFFDRLRLPDVVGNPTMAEACGEWWRDIIRALFGSLDPVAMTRWIEEIFALVAKKNSKTTYGAGLMLTALFMNRRPLAEFLFIAVTHSIADLAFSQAAGMIELDPELKRRYRVREHIKEIRDRITGARLKIKTFDLNVLTGPRPAGVFLDELHLLGGVAAASKIIRQLRGGREAIPEGFLVFCTTQSEDAPAGAFAEELGTARAIRDGHRSGKMLPALYEFPRELQKLSVAGEPAPWENPAAWPMVTPNLGRSLRLDSLIEKFGEAKEKGDASLRGWASQHLNVEIGLALHSARWAGADFWEGAADPSLSLLALLARSEVVCIGIDGGGLDDLLGLAVLGRESGSERWLHWGRAWAHTSVLERRKSEAARLRDLAAAEELVIVERLGDDIDELAQICEHVLNTGLLAQIGLDPVGIGVVVDALAQREMTGESGHVIGISQGWKLSGAIKTAERKLAEGSLAHCGQALMAWAVGNAKVEPRGNAITITKQAAGYAKIDPVMALFDAVACLSQNPPSRRSVYEKRGLLVI
ncbi:MAG TPA: terminase TerL endonuclease subunit [Stellaceae bacterium]|nr:terminase TerL endonuclease subunit [Stellaceae bacterium]